MSNTRLLEKIDAEITEKNLSKHPFYQGGEKENFRENRCSFARRSITSTWRHRLQHWETTGIHRGIYPIIVAVAEARRNDSAS